MLPYWHVRTRVLKLLRSELVQHVTEPLLDDIVRDLLHLVGRTRLLNGSGGQAVEGDDVAHHFNALVEGAVLVVLGEGVLLQVVILDQPET
jgi:hypothetical protein